MNGHRGLRPPTTRLVVAGPDRHVWTPAIKPGWYDNSWASLGHVATSETRDGFHPKLNPVWKPRKIPEFNSTVPPIARDSQQRLIVEPPRLPKLESAVAVPHGTIPSLFDMPHTDPPKPVLVSSTPRDTCLWLYDPHRGTNAACVPRGIANMPLHPFPGKLGGLCLSGPLRPSKSTSGETKKWDPPGRKSNVAEANGAAWMTTRQYTFAAVNKSIKRSGASPMPTKPSQVSTKELQKARAAKGGLAPAPIGILEKEPSLASFQGLGYSAQLSRQQDRIVQMI